MSREEIEGRVRNEIQREISHETWRGLRVESYRFKVPIPPELRGSEWDWGYCSHWSTHPGAEPLVSLFDAAQALTALLAENERLERIVIQARKVSDVLAVYGFPVSDAHWNNASGGMSVEARGLHLAADDLRNALNKDPDQ